MKIYFFFLTLLISKSSFSQSFDSLKRVYDIKTIYRNGNSFVKGNEKLSFRDLKMEFISSDLGMADYNKAKTYKTIGTVSAFASITSLLITPSLIRNNTNQRSGVYTALGLQFFFSIVSVYSKKISNDLLDRAIWQRNKDVLFKP